MADNAASKIFDQAVKDSINMARVEAGSAKKVQAFLGGLESELVKILNDNKDLAPGKKAKLEKILAASQDAIGQTYTDIAAENAKDLAGVASYQSKAAGKMVNGAIGVDVMGAVLTENQLSALVKDTFVQGHPAHDWWMAQSDGFKNKFTAAVNTGYALGEDIDAITRRIRGTKANGYKDGVMEVGRREGEALARTAVQTISNTAKLESYKQLGDTIKGIEWVATLDTRTTIICRALDGKVWTWPDLKPVGHDKVFPGVIAHWNCRSTQVAVLYSWGELSGKKIKALDGATYAQKLKEKLKAKGMSDEQIAVAEANARASMDGQVPETMDQDAWFKKKPDAEVKALIGPSRFNLLSQGKLTVTDLTDQNNRPLTVAQLHAGLDAGTLPVETEGASFAPFDMAKAKPPGAAEAQAAQEAAAKKIADVMANPKAIGNSILADNLSKIQAKEPSLTPAETLAKAEEATAAKIAANTKSSQLSKAKKALLEGKEPSPAQKALIDDMGEDEKAAWLEAIADAKKAKAADTKAAQVAKLDAAVPGIVKANAAALKKPGDIDDLLDALDTDGLDTFEKSALKDKITAGLVDAKVDAVKAKITASLKADPMKEAYTGDTIDDVFSLYDLDPKTAATLEGWIFGEIGKTQDGLTVQAWEGHKTKVFAIEKAKQELGPDASPSSILDKAKAELMDIVTTDVWTNGSAASKKAVQAITGMNGPAPAGLKKWLEANNMDAETFLTQWDTLTAEKAQQATNSSVLSKAKKKLVAGEQPTAAQKALIDSLDPDAKQAFDESVADAKAKIELDAQKTAAAQAQQEAAVAKQQADAAKAQADAAAKAAQQAVEAKTAKAAQQQAQIAQQQAQQAPSDIPHPDDLKIVGTLGGSTGAQLAQDSKGNRYVVKRGAAPDHVRTEQTADDLYRAFGLNVPDGALFETSSGPVKVTRFLEGGRTLATLKGAEREAAFAELRKGFQVDALMANWDVAGTGLDNVMVTPDGKVWRIDNGGSLKYRAQGSTVGKNWDRFPDELWTMREKGNISEPIYGSMDFYQIARGIDGQDFSGLGKVAMDSETREILSGRIQEMKHLATRALDYEFDGYNLKHGEAVARGTFDLRKAGVSDTLPKKLAVSGTYNLVDENGRAFGSLRTQAAGGAAKNPAPSVPLVQGDVFGDDILTATKALASCAISKKQLGAGSATGKFLTANSHKTALEALLKSGTDEQKEMAKGYLAQLAAMEDIMKKGGIPDAPPPLFNIAVPKATAKAPVKPTVESAKSVVKQWEAMMAAEGINTSPIAEWMGSQSGDSWSTKTQGMKVAFAKAFKDPEAEFYWGGNRNNKSSWTIAQTHYQSLVKTVGSEEKLTRLVTSWHALNQEILSEVDSPWIDRERRAVLLLRTVDQGEIDGSFVKPDKDGNFTAKRGTTESHSIFKPTIVMGSITTAQAVPFSRVLASYWTERPGKTGGSGFYGDHEAEIAANTSGIRGRVTPSNWKQPKYDDTSKDATTWNVPLDHLRP